MILTAGQKHLLRLTRLGTKSEEGWAKVSKVVWPLMMDIPQDLVELDPSGNGSGRARLTERGEAVLDYSYEDKK